MHSRLQLILVAIVGLVAACSGSTDESAPPASTISAVAATTTTTTTTTTSTTTPPATTAAATTTPTTAARSLGGYNTTPLRSDGQRVTFRLTTPDGVTGEVAFAPPDTTISSIEASIELVRPNGQPGGGGDIFTAASNDAFFASFCAGTLGGKCAPTTSEPIADGNRVETFARATGGTTTRVVFGPWAMLVQDRDVANAFRFHSGTDGFPLVVPRAAGYSTTNPALQVFTAAGPRYLMRSTSSGTCSGDTATSGLCDRGLSIEASGPFPAPSIRRIN
ncbi:MAG TPA: hypothetical protein VM282_08920 [Acidimicrobiales bacterium]|nr:hypothetical protein [Acidimicrobiales bacterium]